MNSQNLVSVVVIGCGNMGQGHLRTILKMKDSTRTRVVALVEPSEEMVKQTLALFKEYNLSLPPVFTNLDEFFKSGIRSETSFIITPHHLHFSQSKACLENAMDVLLEKPMVMNEREALDLIEVCNKTGKLLVVAFNGSLSPAIRKVKELIAKNSIGEITQVSALIYQNWKKAQTGKWRQLPEISGGGFLFDSGSHMLNTVVDILDDEVEEVFAIQDNRGTPVEVCSAITVHTAKGTLVNLTGAGDSIGCNSEIFIFGTKGVIHTGAWGEKLEIRKEGESNFSPLEYPESSGVWEQFLKVREGKLKNPCPPEVGLRFAKLMDMIHASASEKKPIRKKA